MKRYIFITILFLAVCYSPAKAGKSTGGGVLLSERMAFSNAGYGIFDNESLVLTANRSGFAVKYSFKTGKTLKVFNLLGRCIAKVELTAGSGSMFYALTLERGSYIYSLEEGTQTYAAKKFVVQ
jgi:hypothetical protein